MNKTFQNFRELQATQEKDQTKKKLLGDMGQAVENAIKYGLDEMELRHPEICDKMLELHLLLMYEVNPSLEPLPEPVEDPPAGPVNPE